MHRIGLVICPGVQVLSLAPISVFEMANVTSRKAIYDVRLVSESGGPVRTSIGITIDTEAFHAPDFDTLIVAAATEIQAATPTLLAFLRNALRVSRRIAAPSTLAF